MLLSKKFRHFITTAQKKSLTAAAESLFMTTSPLCRSIKELEAWFGSPLFTRHPPGFCLTPKGKILYERLLPFYTSITGLECDIVQKQRQSGTLSSAQRQTSQHVGTDSPHYYHLLMRLPDDALHTLEVVPQPDLEAALKKGPFTLFFSHQKRPLCADIECTELPEERLLLGVNKTQTGRHSTSLDYLSRYPLIQYPDNLLTHHPDSIEYYLKRNDLVSKKIKRPHFHDHLMMLNSGPAVGIIPISLRDYIHDKYPNVILYPLVLNERHFSLKIYAYYLRKNSTVMTEYLSPLMNG